MNISSQKPIKNEKQQYCMFCARHGEDMPVFSCCLGRMGICLDCAEKARTALLEHQETKKRKEADHEDI